MANDTLLKLRFKAIDKLSGTTDKIKNKFNGLNRSLGNVNKKFTKMKMKSEGVSKSLKKVGKGMGNVGRGMALGVTAPVVAFGVSTIRAATTFEASMNKISAITRKTGKPLKDMRDLAKDLGSKTQYSASQAADAMSFLGMAGFDTNEILKATPKVLDLAAASGIELARAADIASNIMGAFNIEAENTNRVADVLALTTSKANVNMEMMAEAMKDAGPVAQKYGASLEETSSLIGKLGDVGIQGSKAGTTLKNMFLRLAAPTSRITKIMDKLGVKTIDKNTGKMARMSDVLRDMGKAFDAKGIKGAKKLAVLNEVFGLRAVAGAGKLLDAVGRVGKDGVTEVDKLTNSLNNATKGMGASAEMAEKMKKGAPGAMKSLASAFEGLQIAIAESGVLEVFTKILLKLTGFLRWLSKANPAILKWGSAFALVAAAIGPLLIALGWFLSILPGMMLGIGTLKILMLGLAGSLSATLIPLLPLIGALALLGVAGVMIYKQWGHFRAFFSDFFTSPLEQVKDLVMWIGKLALKMSGLGAIGRMFGLGKSTDDKLREQGFKIQDGPSGEALGGKEVIKKSEDLKQRQRDAKVNVNFSNMPQNTSVISEDKDDLLNIGTGLTGAF